MTTSQQTRNLETMDIVRTIPDCREACHKLHEICLVPTMGALHEGHGTLLREAKKHGQSVVVSIFVNPTQFGPREDYTRYPRTMEADLELCRQEGVDLVFNPLAEEMYPQGMPDIAIDLPSLTTVLEGRHRPGHFKGVCQVVAKLLNIVQPSSACFGQKDFQQLRVIEAMVTALNLPVEIVPCKTHREADGLAFSSRNRFLTPEDRARALSISRGLFAARDELAAGIRQTNRLTATVQRILLEQHLSIDYIAAVDLWTLLPIDTIDRPTALLVAARVGNVRLIDNLLLQPPA